MRLPLPDEVCFIDRRTGGEKPHQLHWPWRAPVKDSRLGRKGRHHAIGVGKARLVGAHQFEIARLGISGDEALWTVEPEFGRAVDREFGRRDAGVEDKILHITPNVAAEFGHALHQRPVGPGKIGVRLLPAEAGTALERDDELEHETLRLELLPGRLRSHQAVVPPSTRRSVPVTKLLSSDARNSAAEAISSGWPGRFSMIWSVIIEANSLSPNMVLV